LESPIQKLRRRRDCGLTRSQGSAAAAARWKQGQSERSYDRILREEGRKRPCDGATCRGKDREVFRLQTVTVGSLSLSTDGRELAFITRSGKGQTEMRQTLMILPTAGGAPRELCQTPDSITGTGWARNHVLVYSSREHAFLSFPATGGGPKKSLLELQGLHFPFEINPDGSKIALRRFGVTQPVCFTSASASAETGGQPAAGAMIEAIKAAPNARHYEGVLRSKTEKAATVRE
jgi:hypothetical protein